MSGPAAEGARIEWQEVPGPVRAAIEDVCGAGVAEARTQPGGFSPGLAARVRCANGARFFVKAVSAQANPDTPGLHRQEGRVLAALEPVITEAEAASSSHQTSPKYGLTCGYVPRFRTSPRIRRAVRAIHAGGRPQCNGC